MFSVIVLCNMKEIQNRFLILSSLVLYEISNMNKNNSSHYLQYFDFHLGLTNHIFHPQFPTPKPYIYSCSLCLGKWKGMYVMSPRGSLDLPKTGSAHNLKNSWDPYPFPLYSLVPCVKVHQAVCVGHESWGGLGPLETENDI